MLQKRPETKLNQIAEERQRNLDTNMNVDTNITSEVDIISQDKHLIFPSESRFKNSNQFVNNRNVNSNVAVRTYGGSKGTQRAPVFSPNSILAHD